MRKVTKAMLMAAVLLSAGCTITKTPEVVGGSKVTGLVRLGYSEAPLQNAQVDNYVAQGMANRQCQQWGYATAEAYGSPIKTCSVISGDGCLNDSVILEYQCRGVVIPVGAGSW